VEVDSPEDFEVVNSSEILMILAACSVGWWLMAGADLF
jgi:hypothetical protein